LGSWLAGQLASQLVSWAFGQLVSALVPTDANAQPMLMLVLSIACCGNAPMPN